MRSSQKYWVIAFHPETLTDMKMEDQVEEVLLALKKFSDNINVVLLEQMQIQNQILYVQHGLIT